MTNSADRSLGRFLALVALDQVVKGTDGTRSALWVTGFETTIVRAALAEISKQLRGDTNSSITVKVGTADPATGIDQDFLLAPGEQLTAWRNVTGDGESVLLFDWGVAPDGQGLSAVRRFDGAALMDESQTEKRFAMLAHEAWVEAGGEGACPEQLRVNQRRVWRGVTEQEEEARSLRRLGRFLIDSASDVVKHEVRTSEAVNRAVSHALPCLGLFPDSQLFSPDGAAEGRIRKNVKLSSGVELADDVLVDRIRDATFTEAALGEIEIDESAAKQLMAELVTSIGSAESILRQLDFPLWLEVFEKPTKKVGLGSQIRHAVETIDPARLEEFDSLLIQESLDQAEQEAAAQFLAADAPVGQPHLSALIPKLMRRRIEKVAYPTSLLVEDPLRALLRELSHFDDEEDGTVVLRTEGNSDTGEWSRWLFGFLYGNSLQRIQSGPGLRLELEVEDWLLPSKMPILPSEDEPFDVGGSWSELRLVVEVEGVAQRRFRWDPSSEPGLIATAALIGGFSVGPGEFFDGTFDSYLDQFGDPRTWARDHVEIADTGIRSDLVQLKVDTFYSLRDGIDWEALDTYVNKWSGLLGSARESLVPSNSPSEELQQVILSDVIQLSGNRLLMLSTHPLRLRWFADHQRRMVDWIAKALEDGLSLNAENSNLFFDSLERVSPHGTPAVIVGPQSVAIPMRESAGHEEYAPIVQFGAETKDWLSTVDETAIDEMVQVILEYVSTYPHKRDGTSVLLLDRNGDPVLPLRVAKRLRAKSPHLRLQLVVFAPAISHHSIIRSFDEEFSGSEAAEGSLLPDVELLLRSWELDETASFDDFLGSVDIALAPALFGTQINLNASTRDSESEVAGRYDPWTHPAANNVIESGENVVREFLPRTADLLLETWSTLCVRHYRRSPVSREKPENTDFFEMQVQFDRHQDLFLDLHSTAHWVVTLDSFVGRDQIDNLQNKPDIILVRPRVGKNESYTLIVSSQTGKELVEKRLAPRLVDMGVADPFNSELIASRIYSCGRNVAPGAVLRSLGIGTTVNEVFGLVVARHEVARRYPTEISGSGLVVWLSFDELHRWFSGTSRTRADLGRFTFVLTDAGQFQLDILVIESKYRRDYDHGSAEEQLNRTVDLCMSAFAGGKESRDDRQFWLEELASAVENTSSSALGESDLSSRYRVGDDLPDIEVAVVEAVRSGDIELASVKGVAIAIASGSEGMAPSGHRLGRHDLIRINRPELQEAVGRLCSGSQSVVADVPGASSGAGLQATGPADPRTVSSIGALDDVVAAGETSFGQLIDSSGLDDVAGASSVSVERSGIAEAGLRSRYNRALDIFAVHKVHVGPPEVLDPWQEGPGFYLLRFKPGVGVATEKILNRREDIFLALELPGDLAIRTTIDRGSVVFEIPKVGDEKYGVDTRSLWEQCPVSSDELKAPIGADIEGNAVELNFSSPDSPHLLVAGTTGSGKSVALETLLRGLLRYDDSLLRLRLVDPKGTELVDFESVPHLDGEIGMDAEDAIDILEDAVVEMGRRYELMKQVRARKLVDYNGKVAKNERIPWIVVVLDEYADLTSDPDNKKAIEKLLQRLTQKARAAGIHVIAATQRPSADVISTTIRSNFPAQLALRVKTATDSRIIMDATGAESLAGQGDAFLNTAQRTTRIQVGYLADPVAF